MAIVEGGALVAKTLSELGVTEVFSLCGGHINPIYKACAEFGIRIIDTHHEQGASMAADAYGRVSRKPGVCLVTAGPGFTNTMTGISGAYLANSPLMVISGRSGVEENDRLSLQEIDQQGMAAPVTKWARTIFDAGRIPEYIASAYKRAITGRPGPVYLGMSYEVLYPGCDERKVSAYNTRLPVHKAGAPKATIANMAELIMESKKPVAIVGSGAWYSEAEKSLLDFLEWTKVPCFSLNLGRGIVPDDHQLCLGAASPSAPNGFREITGEADLILLLGVRLSIYIGFGRTFHPHAKIVQIDIDPGEIGRNRPVDLGIAGDLATVLSELTEYMRERYLEPDDPSWLKKVESQWREKWREADKLRKSSNALIHPVRVAKAVEEVMGKEGMLVIDGGDTQAFTDGYFRAMTPGQYLKGGPLGCMGVGVPFAIGAKAAKPEKRVALISGDGAMGMNFMEFETALRHKLPFVAVVCNDGAWGMTKHQIELTYGKGIRTEGVELGMIPFHEVLKVLGGYGELVEKPDDLEHAVERAFSSGVPALVNVVTDPGAVSGATLAITEMMMSANKR